LKVRATDFKIPQTEKARIFLNGHGYAFTVLKEGFGRNIKDF
jgi:hypothetical protein